MSNGLYYPPHARKCPFCGGKMYVKYSDIRKDGLDRLGVHDKVIRRRLACDNCETRMTTYEISAESLKVIKQARIETDRRNRNGRAVMKSLLKYLKYCINKMEEINDNQSQQPEVQQEETADR